jgi:hypothetical protein
MLNLAEKRISFQGRGPQSHFRRSHGVDLLPRNRGAQGCEERYGECRPAGHRARFVWSRSHDSLSPFAADKTDIGILLRVLHVDDVARIIAIIG